MTEPLFVILEKLISIIREHEKKSFEMNGYICNFQNEN